MAEGGSEDELVALCNEMLSQLHVLHRVKHWKDINVSIFITLFEGLWGEPLKDVIRNPRSMQEETHNAQLVIDTLSQDVLNASLSHIQGENLVNGDRETIANLLEVFKGLLEYILDKIESDTSSTADMRDVEEEEDPDLVTPQVIDDILERELSNGYTYSLETSKRSGNQSGYSPSGMENTSDLIALGQGYSPNKGTSFTSDKTGNSTRDLIALGNSSPLYEPGQTTQEMIKETEDIENLLRKYEQTAAVNGTAIRPGTVNAAQATQSYKQSPGGESNASSSVSMPKPVGNGTNTEHGITTREFNSIGQRPRPAVSSTIISKCYPLLDKSTPPKNKSSPHMFTYHLYHHFDSQPNIPGLSRSAHTIGVSQSQSDLPSRLSSATAPVSSGDRLNHSRGKSRSYDNLQNLVADTVAMSREALRTSPLRHRQSNVDHKLTPRNLSDSPRGATTTTPGNLRSAQGTPPARRKVSFLTQRSSDNSLSSNGITPGPEVAAVLDRIGDLSLQSDIRTFYENETRNNNQNNSSSSAQVRPGNKSSPKENELRSDGEKYRQSNVEPLASHLSTKGHTIADELAPRRQADSKIANTFQEYMEKYYGIVEKRDYPLSDSEVSQHSDGVVDYNTSPKSRKKDVRARVLDDLSKHVRKSVRFDDIMDDAAYGQMAPLRRNLRNEDQHTRRKIEALDKMYQFELNEMQEEALEKLRSERKAARKRDLEYRKKVLKSPKMTKYAPSRKYQTSVLTRPRSRTKTSGRGRKRSYSASPSVNRKRSPGLVGSDELLSVLLDEFPYLHLSTETLHELWRKSSQQFERLANAEREVRRKKSKAQVQIEEAQRKQEILTNIMRKELAHLQRMRELKDRQYQSQHVKSKIRDRRLQSARSRKYYEDYQIRMRSKMLKKRTKDELIFKQLFRDAIDIQKNRLRELQRYSKEERGRRAKTQQNQIESMENYYKDQMNMLAEALQAQRQEQEIRSNAQAKVLHQMKSEMRKKMEHEIELFQEQLYRDEDDEYFRQIEADRLRHQLQVSRQAAAL